MEAGTSAALGAAEYQVNTCCHNALGDDLGGTMGCCCLRHASDDYYQFATLDAMATCIHHISWHYYKEEVERQLSKRISVPSLQISSASRNDSG